MAHSVIITTPMPTLDELGRDLGLTKTQQKFIISLVDEKMSGRSTVYAFKNQAKKASGFEGKRSGRARKRA
jgi:hypothetical protein